MRSTKPILLVEDDEVDVMTIKRAARQLKIANRLDVVGHGEEALAYLSRPGNRRPCIILLDLNMPRMNGIEFLKRVKQVPDLRSIPVVVMTTSREEQDKVDSFNLGVAGYMIKPADYLQFVEVVRAIDLYWTISEIPGEE
jgi:CheY-like chemotaxis protein